MHRAVRVVGAGVESRVDLSTLAADGRAAVNVVTGHVGTRVRPGKSDAMLRSGNAAATQALNRRRAGVADE